MKLKQLIIMLFLAITVTIMASGTVSAKPKYQKAYEKYLKNNASKQIKIDSYTKVKLSKLKCKTYIDLNGDSVKELVLTRKHTRDGFQRNPAIILTYYKSKVKIIGRYDFSTGGELRYLKGKNSFTYMYRLSGMKFVKVYKLSKGKLKKRCTMECYDPYHYGENKKTVYLKNGKKISYSAIKNEWNKYYKNAKLIK